MSPGRRAALPPAGFHPQPRRRETRDSLIVRFVPEDRGADSRDFDFTDLPVSPALRSAFAAAFAERTRPGRGLRALSSANGTHRMLTSFARYLATLHNQPQQVTDLAPAHVSGWYLQRSAALSSAVKNSRHSRPC